MILLLNCKFKDFRHEVNFCKFLKQKRKRLKRKVCLISQ